MNEEMISVIVPIYNTAKYLEQCLESIQNQTYKNLEIICVNDGSQDNSLEIVNSFAQNDSRFVVISQNNKGLSASRNIGLEKAKGEYIMFVDSDDWIESKTCELAIDTITETNSDLVMWTYSREYESKSLKKTIFDSNKVFNSDECKMLHRRIVGLYEEELKYPETMDSLATVCTKLFRRNILNSNKLNFKSANEIGPWEDGLFTLNYMEYTHKAVFLDESLYHYRKETGLTSISTYKAELQAMWNKRNAYLLDYISDKKLDETYRVSLRNRNVWNLVSLGLNATALDTLKAMKIIKSLINDSNYKDDIKLFKLSYLPVHWKVFFLFAKMRLTLPLFFLLYIMKKAKEKGTVV